MDKFRSALGIDTSVQYIAKQIMHKYGASEDETLKVPLADQLQPEPNNLISQVDQYTGNKGEVSQADIVKFIEDHFDEDGNQVLDAYLVGQGELEKFEASFGKNWGMGHLKKYFGTPEGNDPAY